MSARRLRAVALLALPLVAAAPAARAVELLQCRAQQETFGYRRTVPNASIHVVHVDPFRDMILFDGIWLGMNRIDEAVISGWGRRVGAHGEEILSLEIDRVAGTFDFFIDVAGQPQFARELQGLCGPATFAPRF